MTILADFHTHTSFSGDCTIPMDEMIQNAIRLNVNTLCFTEHNDFEYPFSKGEDPNMFILNSADYFQTFQNLQKKYESQIQLRFGIELGLQTHTAAQNSSLIDQFPFDFVIASSHVCNQKDPYYPEFFENRTTFDAMTEYFESILNNIQHFSSFDVYGHLDYAMRYLPQESIPYNPTDYMEILTEILKQLIDNGKGIECNCGGYAKGLNHPNPHPQILSLYHKLGGEIITIGSDAHHPEFLVHQFPTAFDLLKSIGFKYYTSFTNRKPEFLSLG